MLHAATTVLQLLLCKLTHTWQGSVLPLRTPFSAVWGTRPARVKNKTEETETGCCSTATQAAACGTHTQRQDTAQWRRSRAAQQTTGSRNCQTQILVNPGREANPAVNQLQCCHTLSGSPHGSLQPRTHTQTGMPRLSRVCWDEGAKLTPLSGLSTSRLSGGRQPLCGASV